MVQLDWLTWYHGVNVGTISRISFPRLEKGGILKQESTRISNITNKTTTNVNNYTQIINAPKQPSRLELYRQTKNLLNLVKA